jgi:hypothetical protein
VGHRINPPFQGADMSGADLIRYDAMCNAIAAAYEVDEVKNIRDKALALEIYGAQPRRCATRSVSLIMHPLNEPTDAEYAGDENVPSGLILDCDHTNQVIGIRMRTGCPPEALGAASGCLPLCHLDHRLLPTLL